MGLFENIANTLYTGNSSMSSKAGKAGLGESPLLAKGEVLKGEVIDLSYKEVTLRLEDGRTLHARLSSAMDLSIGQTAGFVVQEADASQIMLKLLTDEDNSGVEDMVDKALLAAGLPKSESAVKAVKALLTAGLPAGSEMIRKMLRYQAANSQTDSSSITALMKHNLPVTKENVSALASYRDFEHRLLSKSTALVEQITAAFASTDTEADDLLHLLEAIFPNAESIHGSASKAQTGNVPETLTKASFKAAEGSVPEVFSEAETALPSASESNVPAGFDRKVFEGLSKENMARSTEKVLSASTSLTEASIDGTLLSPTHTEKEETLTQTAMKTSAKKPVSLPKLSKELRQNEYLRKEFSDFLLSSLVIKPEELTKKDAVQDFYQRVSLLLNRLKAVGDSDSASGKMREISTFAGRMQENISFMNALNQIFPYVQLPLRFPEHLTHGELSVYTKKKDLSDREKEVSILLHLDMDELGSTDINLSILKQRVNASFYLASQASVELVKENLDELVNVLSERGFFMTASVQKREKETNAVNDFLCGQEAPAIKRYRFDIRA